MSRSSSDPPKARRNGTSSRSALVNTRGGTQTDPHEAGWAIGDLVVHLRQIGTDHVHPLKLPKGDPASLSLGVSLGSSVTCDIRIHDPTRRTSKQHAVLLYKEQHWNVLDVGAKNGLFVDGIRQYTARLSPGMVLGVGGVKLIAESLRSVELRCFLARVIGWGWGDEKEAAVEQALQDIRSSHLQRVPIHLQSDDDLVHVAKDLHRHMFGGSAPFVMCDPRRRTRSEDVRSPSNWEDPHEALKAAAGGTLCVRRKRLPAEFAELLQTVRTSPDLTVQLMVCDDGTEGDELFTVPIVIPPLQSRGQRQIAHVIQEYFLEALAAFGVEKPPTAADHAWVAQYSAQSLSDVAKGTRRLVALRRERSLSSAADLLGMKSVSLRRWLGRRELPPGMPPGLRYLDPDGGKRAGARDEDDEEGEGDDDELAPAPRSSNGAFASEVPVSDRSHPNGVPSGELKA